MFDKRTACGHIEGQMDSQKVTQKSQCKDSEPGEGERKKKEEAKITQFKQRENCKKNLRERKKQCWKRTFLIEQKYKQVQKNL